MSKVRIITDSNSGITQEEGKKLGIVVVPMPFLIDGNEYYEDISLTQDKFYELLKKEDAKISTSQPSSLYLNDLFTNELKNYDEIVYIPMSSGLSSSCENALSLAEECFKDKVYVVDNQRISVTMKTSVMEAIKMASEGKNAKEIHDYLMSTKMKSSIYILVDTLKYLKKGGRVTPAAALLGSMLRIKPVLQIRGYKLDSFFKALNLRQAKLKMIEQAKYDLNNDFKEEYDQGLMTISVAHTQNKDEALKFKEEILNAIPNIKFNFVDPLSLSVSCHIGPGSLAIALAIENK